MSSRKRSLSESSTVAQSGQVVEDADDDDVVEGEEAERNADEKAFRELLLGIDNDAELVALTQKLKLTHDFPEPKAKDDVTYDEETERARVAAMAYAEAMEQGCQPKTQAELRDIIQKKQGGKARYVPLSHAKLNAEEMKDSNFQVMSAMIDAIVSREGGEGGHVDVTSGVLLDMLGIPARLDKAVEEQNKIYGLKLKIRAESVPVELDGGEAAWLERSIKVIVEDLT
jgi:hypothetical protein